MGIKTIDNLNLEGQNCLAKDQRLFHFHFSPTLSPFTQEHTPNVKNTKIYLCKKKTEHEIDYDASNNTRFRKSVMLMPNSVISKKCARKDRNLKRQQLCTTRKSWKQPTESFGNPLVRGFATLCWLQRQTWFPKSNWKEHLWSIKVSYSVNFVNFVI